VSLYLTVAEAAEYLRTTPRALYSRISRGQLAGVVRDGGRVLVRRDVLERSLLPLDGTGSRTRTP
jgi:excisionase family DNA binding protein